MNLLPHIQNISAAQETRRGQRGQGESDDGKFFELSFSVRMLD